MYAVGEKPGEKGLGDISLVCIDLSQHIVCQTVEDLLVPVVNIRLCQHEVNKFSLLIADKMQLESIVPAHRTLASGSIAFEDLVLVNALVVANRYTGAVDETNASTFSKAEQLKEQGHLYCYTRLQLNEAIVGHGFGEVTLQIAFHITQIVVFEVAVGVEVETDENRHDFTVRHLPFTPAVFLSIAGK
jgi:hypothetical protein